MSKIKVELQADGSVKIDARAATGDEAQILAELQALAASVGGELTVEKHIETHHHHHSHDEKSRHRH